MIDTSDDAFVPDRLRCGVELPPAYHAKWLPVGGLRSGSGTGAGIAANSRIRQL